MISFIIRDSFFPDTSAHRFSGISAGGEWGLDCSEAEGGLLIVDRLYNQKASLSDGSDGLIHRGSIINSNLSHVYQTEYMFLYPERRHFDVCLCRIQIASVDSK